MELIEENEDVGARGFTSRVFNRTYSIPILDHQGNFTGQYRYEIRKLVDKSNGLCYDSSLNQEGDPDPACLEPTNSNFTNDPEGGWKIDTGPARVKIAQYSNASPLVSYNIPFRVQNASGGDEKRTFSLDIQGGALFWYDVSTKQTALIEYPAAVSGSADGNRVIFEDAFACGDLELVYDKGSFHQNVVIKNAGALPSPELSGINSANAELRVITEIEDKSTTQSAIDAYLDDGRGELIVALGEDISKSWDRLSIMYCSEKKTTILAKA